MDHIFFLNHTKKKKKKSKKQDLPTVAVILKLSLVQLHGQIWSLEVQCHHLTASIPKDLKQLTFHPVLNQYCLFMTQLFSV